jgi:CheY-like chemotaxis protein
MSDACRMLELQALNKGLELKVEADETLCEDNYRGDSGRIRQILINLCGNAIKFTHRGEIKLTLIRAPTDNPDIDLISFGVSDTGIGISPEQLETIFHKFTQADSSINRRYGGSGLGLSISRSLSEAMGGELTAASTLGLGSEFVVHLPLVKDKTLKTLTLSEPQSQAFTHASHRILLVEDSSANVLVAGYFLEAFGYAYDVAEDGRTAVDYIESGNTYGAILMDVQMPGLDGIEATKLIRAFEARQAKSSQRVPIIAMTAHAMTSDRERCMTAGMDDYIAKPFNPEILQTKLMAVLSRSLVN